MKVFIMKNLKLKTAILLLTVFSFIGCDKDDDTNTENQEATLVSIGTCGDFFAGVNLPSLCGVEEQNTQGIGSDVTCSYIIRENAVASQELYTATLWEAANVDAAINFYEILSNDFFPGEMLTPLNDLGDEAIYAEDVENADYTLVFRFKNMNVALSTDELLFELGCDNPQLRLRELANLILNKVQ